jgi:hypothetical protein
LLAGQQLLHGRPRTFDPVERLFETPLDQPLSQSLDRPRPTREGLRDSLIGPVRSVGIGLQEDPGPPHLLSRPLQFLDDAFEAHLALDPESAGRLTLRRPGGAENTVLSTNIDAIAGTGQSLMPEGLEARVSPREMADLIAFLEGVQQ